MNLETFIYSNYSISKNYYIFPLKVHCELKKQITTQPAHLKTVTVKENKKLF